MFNQQMARIIQHHLGEFLKLPTDIAQILVEQQKNNTAFLAAWQVLVETHEKSDQIGEDGGDIVQIQVENVKQSFVAFHPPMARLRLFFQKVRLHVDFIYQLYLMLNEWQKSLKLNDYPQHYLNLLEFLLKIKHYDLEGMWLIEDLISIDESLIAKIATKNQALFKNLLAEIKEEPKIYFKENQDGFVLLKWLPLSEQGYRDCSHYLLEYLEFYIIHMAETFFNQSQDACYSKQNLKPLPANVIDFLLN